MDSCSVPISLSNKNARSFSERWIFLYQQTILHSLNYFTRGDTINNQLIVSMLRYLHIAGTHELTDALQGVTH